MLEKEAIAFEQQREGDYDWRKVILHKQGKFYRAYEISAYLIKHYLCTEEFQKQRGDSKLLQVKHYAKKNYDYDVRGFLVHTLVPCALCVVFIVAAMFTLNTMMSPSVGRFFVTFGVAEMMILGLGYWVVLDKSEREKALSFVRQSFNRGK